MTSITDFQPSQILCLEHGDTCLYAELIQIAPKNKSRRGWVRPLILKVSPTRDFIAFSSVDIDDPTALEQPTLYDLRQGSDLLCPIALFRAALDTEVVPLLTQLAHPKTQTQGDRIAHQQLHRFIHDVCQMHLTTL
ncbi:hypothetical protein H6F95_20780 [Cyanobacteria bacterium FACHB-471]|nr:hypothetical protein [Cyanobacteria bacterium FACHB-471]